MTFNTRIAWRLIGALLLLILAVFATQRLASQITGEIGEGIDVGVELPDMSFFSAEDVDLSVTSSDDVFAAGGTIDVDATTADHLIIAGGEITVKNVVIHDLIAAGGEIDLVSGTVEDDIVVAGGELLVRSGFNIGSSAVLTGGEARIEAAVPTDLRVGAATVFVNSTVGGDARLSGDTVTLGPNARIEGDLLYRTEKLELQPGAIVLGEQKILPTTDRSGFENWGRGAGELMTKLFLAVVVGFTVLVVVIAMAVPSLMHSSAQLLRTRPLRSLGIGVMVAVIVPFAVVALFASIVGVPLAMLLIAICLTLTPIAVAATAYLLGAETRRVLTKQDDVPSGVSARLLWPALGALVILLLGLIPFLGLLVWLFAMLFGLGAVVSKGGEALAFKA